jgi:hypothetical protein
VYPSLLLISISFDLFKIVFLGDNASSFGLGSSGGSTLLCNVIGNFIAFGFNLILFILFILVAFWLFNIFFIVTLGFRF